MFGRKTTNPQDRKLIKYFGFIFIAANRVGCFFRYICNPKKWRKFWRNEKREIEELTTGVESPTRFWHDSCELLKDLFIPHQDNGYRPKLLRPKSLFAYAVTAVTVKIIVTAFLFLTYPTPAQLSAIITSNMVGLINQSRQAEGVAPLKENLLLSRYAQTKGQDMISRSYFAHDTPEGKRPWQWIDKNQFDYVYAGENLAMDFTSAEAVHDAFLKSPSHRRNILNDRYLEVGIAVISGKLDGHQTTLLVEFFGTQRKDLGYLAAVRKASAQAKGVATKEVPKETTTEAPKKVTLKPKTAGVSDEELLPPSEPPATLPDVSATGEDNQQTAEQQSADSPAFSVNEGGPIMVLNDSADNNWVDRIIEYSNIFFIAFLIFMLISLALNIFIKVRVQHPSVILQSIAVIALLLALILVKFHFVEQVSSTMLIL